MNCHNSSHFLQPDVLGLWGMKADPPSVVSEVGLQALTIQAFQLLPDQLTPFQSKHQAA